MAVRSSPSYFAESFATTVSRGKSRRYLSATMQTPRSKRKTTNTRPRILKKGKVVKKVVVIIQIRHDLLLIAVDGAVAKSQPKIIFTRASTDESLGVLRHRKSLENRGIHGGILVI